MTTNLHETINWQNYFVETTRAYASDGHLRAVDLRSKIKSHPGGEAYHCAYDLEPRPDFTDYKGLMRPALGHVWFDFDSHADPTKNIEAGVQALEDTRRFVEWLGVDDLFICYSGSKGFHVGVPFYYLNAQPATDLGQRLNRLAQTLKKIYPSLDTTIYNANRKFRALGSKHKTTGLFKIKLKDLSPSLDAIKKLAKKRGDLEIPEPHPRDPLPKLVALFNPPVAEAPKPASAAATGDKVWTAPEGTAAFNQCSFLAFARDEQAKVNEPQWYAALSVVARFQEGRKQCHAISHKHPKYQVADCNEKIDQALKESAPRTCASIETLWDGCKTCPLHGKINSPVNIFEARFWERGKNGALYPNYNALLEEYVREHPYKTITDMKAVYLFLKTHYVETNPIEICEFAERKFEPKPKQKERQEFTHKVFANHPARRSFFNEGTEGKINFRNGVFDTTSKILSSHSPDYGFRHVLPYDYSPTESCETFQWWIKDVMLGDDALVAILQEFMGYIVRGGEYKYHKALWLSGSGRNGKSTFLDVLKALIGGDNYSALSIRQIINDKFSSADLDGKIANFSEETSPEELSDSGPFKNLTGDGDVPAQKKYGDIYKFRNRAKLIMTYNEVPMLKDLSPGMLSRPIIIPWKKDLSDESKQDKTLKARLLSELPGIFNFAYAGWERLEAQGEFTKSAKSALEMEEIRRSSCSAAQWFADTIELVEPPIEGAHVLKPRQLYEAYAQTVGQYAYGEQKFYKRLTAIPEVAKRRCHSRQGTEYFSMKFRRSSLAAVEF